MQFPSRFTLAVHVLLCIDTYKNDKKLTSEFLAASAGVNPVMIRNILGKLREAGYIEVVRGTGGASLTRSPADISLFDIYKATDCCEEGSLFRFHESPSNDCPVGRNIHIMLDPALDEAQTALENRLAATSLADLQKTAYKHMNNKYGLRLYR